MSFNLMLQNVDTVPFYFGIGGIGDALLLLSTFYDDIEQNAVDVVFVANDHSAIKTLSNSFPKIRRWWIFPRKAFYPTKIEWESLIRNERCLGTGVTPKNFDYVGDWIECGKSTVFDYYGVTKNPAWAKRRESINPKYITVQMYGGPDSNRISVMPVEYVEEIVKQYDSSYSVILIGSKRDITKSEYIENCRWVTDMEDSINRILLSNHHYGVNSWAKTLSGLAGVPTTIYPSSYVKPPIEVFNHPVDPSDYVFLKDWGFEYAQRKYI